MQEGGKGSGRGESWSLETHAEQFINKAPPGNKSLKRCVLLLAHLFELQREHGAAEPVEAFTAQAYKASCEALAHGGVWDAAWPLLGLPDPDERVPSMLSPAERVASAAYLKEKKMLRELHRANPKDPPPGRTPKSGGGGGGGAGGGAAASTD